MLTHKVSIIITGTIFVLLINCSFVSVVDAQSSGNRLPILLIHGYAQDQSVWNTWTRWLGQDNFSNVYPITFRNDDRCGSVQQHAAELSDRVDELLRDTGKEKVNIVAHSKGGLDSRAFLATGTDKVANLIMIGTPKRGTPASFADFTWCPSGAAKDLFPGSPATQVEDHPENTNYYTIAGNWLENRVCFLGGIFLADGGNCLVLGEDDGLVAVSSVESNSNYVPLGEAVPFYHTDLLNQREVYERALPVLSK